MNLTLDSRNRIDPTSPNTCKFLMQDGVIGHHFELVSFQFANYLHNVTSTSNKLYISGVLAATITPGYWEATDFVIDLNSKLKTYFVTAVDVVVLSPSNILTWVLPAGTITASSMNRVLGVIGTPSGSFSTNLFLVGPLQLAFNSQQLQVKSYNSFPNTNWVSGTIPVNSGYLEVQLWEPQRGWQLEFTQFMFNVLEVTITNAQNAELVNIGEWSCTFLVK